MPVLVTSAQRPLARRIARRLLDEGGEVRAYAHGDVALLRAAGAIIASGEVDDEGRLEAAMAQTHTVVHVGGGLLSRDPDQLERDARTVALAATNAGVRRIIALSLPGADPDASEPLRRAKGRVERMFAAAGPPSVIVRTSLVDTEAMTDALLTSGLGQRFAATRLAPVRVGDLVELVVGFDRLRSRAEEGHLVVSADGPRRVSLGDHLARKGGTPPGRGGLVGRRMVDEDAVPLLAGALAAGPWWTEDPVVPDGWALAGVEAGEPDDASGPAA